MDYFKGFGQGVANDHTLQRVRRDGVRVARALPRATGDYIVEKAPVIQWAPRYQPRWLLYDTLAGITIGVLLIPQALAYAKIATIPVQYGLMSSWLPNFLYFIMGTSKGTIPSLLGNLNFGTKADGDMQTCPLDLPLSWACLPPKSYATSPLRDSLLNP